MDAFARTGNTDAIIARAQHVQPHRFLHCLQPVTHTQHCKYQAKPRYRRCETAGADNTAPTDDFGMSPTRNTANTDVNDMCAARVNKPLEGRTLCIPVYYSKPPPPHSPSLTFWARKASPFWALKGTMATTFSRTAPFSKAFPQACAVPALVITAKEPLTEAILHSL